MPLINYIGNRQESLGVGAGGFVRGDAPSPPPLSVEYLIVAGGTAGAVGTGGSAGGVLSGSLSIPFSSTTTINVGSGAISLVNGQSSSISHPALGFVGIAGGIYAGNSGNNFSQGIDGANETHGGGAGSSENGQDGQGTSNGSGGNGSLWLNGFYYGGGGGGTGGIPTPLPAGAGGRGGGGSALSGEGPDGLPNQLNGRNGTGGGAAGTGTKGGDGIVILRYSTSSVVPPYDNAITGGDLIISGGYVYRSFTTGSSQLTYSY